MMPDIKLTVLDQSPVHPTETAPQLTNAGQMSIELAKLCDELGYSRYWWQNIIIAHNLRAQAQKF
jgi:hypothetical protein